jgi:NAD(P)-dependent dehydrogenase (short-subunit alcohol dehydrogenase family)
VESFNNKIAVVTGGGSGMGRELVRQLAADGCHVAPCDLSEDNLEETRDLAAAESSGVRITTHSCDVADEDSMLAFRDEVTAAHDTDFVNLVFNNAGLSGGGSFINDSRASWDRCFDVCWGGVYNGTRAFMPLLIASDEGHLVNTASINGFWATLGPDRPHTAYSAAKFAVKGFTEALLTDVANNAPHVGVSVVMPGHIGTSIVINSGRILGTDPKEMSDDELDEARERMARLGMPVEGTTNDQLRQGLLMMGEMFRDNAPMTAAQAATIILDGVREERWRILVGEDAKVLDEMVRESPEEAYEVSFMERLQASSSWALGS